MKLSISNIAWTKENDIDMYSYISEIGYQGIEVAPTRIIEKNPYNHLDDAKKFSLFLKNEFKISISSLQSIWYGISKNLFNSEKERDFLINYTKRCIDFAEIMNCKNIVLGSPKNRNKGSKSFDHFMYFFYEISEYLKNKEVIIAIEPNPVIYNTDFINTSVEAFNLCKKLNCENFKVNVDLGTIIHNNEEFDDIKKNINLVNHIHISEPYLECIKKREIHNELKDLNYDKYLSIEMKNPGDISIVKDTMIYIKELLG